jgi:hypothetical protein
MFTILYATHKDCGLKLFLNIIPDNRANTGANSGAKVAAGQSRITQEHYVMAETLVP